MEKIIISLIISFKIFLGLPDEGQLKEKEVDLYFSFFYETKIEKVKFNFEECENGCVREKVIILDNGYRYKLILTVYPNQEIEYILYRDGTFL